MVTYRTLQEDDAAHLARGWSRSIWNDPITEERLRNLIFADPNFDPAGLVVAVDDTETGERIVGALYALRRRVPIFGDKLEPEMGWITWFYVDPEYRRGGVASAMIERAFTWFRSVGVGTVSFSAYAPNYVVPGIDGVSYPEGAAFLAKHGFTRLYEAVAMDRSLVGYRCPDDVTALKHERMREGYRFQTLTAELIPDAAEFAHREFNEDWGRAIREGVVRGLDPYQVELALDPEGTIVGFVMFGGYEGILERFGPFGVHEDTRGKGIGKILMHDCLVRQKSMGLHGSWFLWTGEKSVAGILYKKYGFEITRRFAVMQRTL